MTPPNPKTHLREFVLDRINMMSRCPDMWASTNEGFVLQVMTLLECMGVDSVVAKKIIRRDWFGLEYNGILDYKLTQTVIEKALDAMDATEEERALLKAEEGRLIAVGE